MQRAARAVYRVRRRIATGFAIGLALVFGYHAVLGHDGITAYAQKRSQDRVLAAEIQKLEAENARLKQHVEHLRNDPDAIEHEARERLHYTRPGEVIYTLDYRARPETLGPDRSRPPGATGVKPPANP
jgi:cell division protein FtsB